MKISEIAKILQVHKSTVYRWINEFEKEGEKCLILQAKKRKKKEGKREGNKGRRNTRKNHMGSKNIEEKFNVKTSYSLENSEKKTENSLHKTLQDRQANRCRLRERLKGVIKKGVKVFFMDESGISHDPSRVYMLLGLIIQVLIF
ncbi:helix-turn-helix domain-containing protein [Saccharolobus islandicus]|uniref:helix-turn-helix domain-containing protein n=1 Tax=Saccharolobus islandicus TaxID=43080 RepID=UPI003D7C631B